MEEQTKIDPEKFAYHVMTSVPQTDSKESDMEEIAKENLAVYLTAYYIARRFNKLENNFFKEDKHEKVSTYQKILSELNQY